MSDKPIETIEKDAHQALEEVKSILQSNQKDSGENKEKLEKLNEAIDLQETKNQELVGQLAESDKKQAELEELVKSVEKRLCRMPGGADAKESVKAVAWDKFLRKGEAGLEPDEVKSLLRTDVDTQGGYLSPPEYVNEIIKDITERSPIRQLATVRQVRAGVTQFPKRISLGEAFWRGETQAVSNATSTYGLESISLRTLSAPAAATFEELSFADFDIASEIQKDATERFEQKEGAGFVNGDGVVEPSGFMSDPNVSSIVSGDATELTIASMLQVPGELKTGYAPMYGFNRKTLAALRAIEASGDGHTRWMQGNIAAGVPNQFNGITYVEIPDMDDIAAGTFPVIFADFRKAYTIVDSSFMRTIRDDYTRKKEGIVEFLFERHVGGQVVQPEAMVKIEIAA